MKISVIGSGAWGTALAQVTKKSGLDVVIWSRNKLVVDDINNNNQNSLYLKGIKLNPDIMATSDFKEAIEGEILLLVVPSQVLRDICGKLKEAGLKADTPLVICCKGIEQTTHKLMSEVVREVFPENPVAVLSGPNFADEIAKGLPAATTIAADNVAIDKALVSILGTPTFRTYNTEDIIGAQIGGAVKNVLAIACGISAGKGFGENAKAALITRGLAEIGRLCVAKGGDFQTLMCLCGVGDIMLTCSSMKSRNMSLGYELGKGRSLDSVMSERNSVAEGVITSKSVMELARSLGVDMPICEAVYKIIHEKAGMDETITNLLSRPLLGE